MLPVLPHGNPFHSFPERVIPSDCSHLVWQYAGERRDSHPWILNTKDYRIKSRVLSHLFLKIITGA